jgi:HEAT repeat protein
MWFARNRRPLKGTSIIALYLIALAWLWLGPDQFGDWYFHFARGVLLAVPLGILAFQALSNSGSLALRRARVLADRLANRRDWPADLFACRSLPEVKELREALRYDPTPALNLVNHPKTAVRVAALSALELRKNWRRDQADFILDIALHSEEPALRAAATRALAKVDDRLVIEALAELVCDPSPEVRQATIEALLWDSEHRWQWIRSAVRRVLSDSAFEKEGPLPTGSRQLPAEAIADLEAWVGERGILAGRAAQTLVSHYRTSLCENPDDSVVEHLQRQLADDHTPAALRLELAKLFDESAEWPEALLLRILEPANPAPLRLFAAETLLRTGPDPAAEAALHEIARFPNREIALTTAAAVQRYLGVDLGLPLGQPLPPLNSRTAVEVTRRVLEWAEQKTATPIGTSSEA